MATDATRAPGVCLLQHPGEVACLVRPAVDLPQRAPPQVLVGVDQRAPAEEGPLPDLLTGDRMRGLQLTAGALPAAGIRAAGFWEPGGAGAWYLSWITITGCEQFRLADLLVQRLRRANLRTT